MNRVIVLLLALTCASPLFAQCPSFALHGDWTVFYRDNKAPDSVLSPGSVIEIRYFSEHDQFTVQMKDPAWTARRNTWEAVCVDDVVVLTGIVQERGGPDLMMVEMSRVTDERELVTRSNGIRKLDQLSIRVMDCFGVACEFAGNAAPSGQERPAADPGHAHADR